MTADPTNIKIPPFRPGIDACTLSSDIPSGINGKYERIGADIGALVDRKNTAYGNSIHEAGQIVRILYPRGINPDQYDDVLALIRIIDKMFRIANDKKAFGEDPFMDIAGYGILKCRRRKTGDS